MTKSDLLLIRRILKDSYQSEDYTDYADEDSWGPSMGAQANDAKQFNKKLKQLIKIVSLEIKKLE